MIFIEYSDLMGSLTSKHDWHLNTVDIEWVLSTTVVMSSVGNLFSSVAGAAFNFSIAEQDPALIFRSISSLAT